MGKRHREADRAVDAHVERGEVVKKDHSTDAVRFAGFANDGSHHRIVATRLITHRTAEPVMFLAKHFGLFSHRPTTEIRATGNNDTGRFALGVRVDNLNCRCAHG